MLSDLQIKKAAAQEKPYKLADARGMYLLVKPSGKYWRLDYRFAGKRRTLALGVYPFISLAEARTRLDGAKRQLESGQDPCEAKALSGNAPTLKDVADEWFASRLSKWAPNHSQKIRIRLDNDLLPWLGNKEIAKITASEMLITLRRVEARGAVDTAHRCLQYLQAIGRYAIVTGRASSNPAADLKGALSTATSGHYASITNPDQIRPLLRAIDDYQGNFITRCALQLAPLVFVRPGELRSAEWSEFSLDSAEWKIPANKMKMRRPHLVPLAQQAIEILRELRPLTGDGKFLFPSVLTPTRSMSENTITTALRRMGYTKKEMTGHGFRSTASTILHEMGWDHDLIELQLAHSKRDKVSAAYNYAQHIPRRKKMMQWWADYLDILKSGQRPPDDFVATIR